MMALKDEWKLKAIVPFSGVYVVAEKQLGNSSDQHNNAHLEDSSTSAADERGF